MLSVALVAAVALVVGVAWVDGAEDFAGALGEGLGGAAGNVSGSHDVLPVVVAAPAVAVPAAMARVSPEAAVARTVPAIRVTVAGRACAKRIKRPTCGVFVTPPPTRSAAIRLLSSGVAGGGLRRERD